MRVQRVLMPGSEVESWTVLGEDQVPVEPVERFLAFLTAIERSPNTIKAYAHDLKDWFVFLAGRGLDWRSVTVEDVAGFVAWLRLPPAARDGRVAVPHGGASLFGGEREPQARAGIVLQFHARHGVPLAGVLTAMAPAVAEAAREARSSRSCITSPRTTRSGGAPSRWPRRRRDRRY